MHATLVIMAAGMGSRYGGDKQIDGIGPSGEILMEYSIYDAIRAGFDKIVFIIKPGMEDTLRALCGERIAQRVEVAYAYQSFDSLPAFYALPAQRVKPFGTVHALLCAKDVVNEPFAVLNADDYYGVNAFKTMYDALADLAPQNEACMVGYRLKNTVSKNGTVTRGVCSVSAAGALEKVKETYKIAACADGTIRDMQSGGEGVLLDGEALVSMNFWGFTPWIFTVAQAYFDAFLRSLDSDNIKGECLLPVMVDDLMHKSAGDALKVRVLSTDAVWFGITYKEDKASVHSSICSLHEQGVYPASLRR